MREETEFGKGCVNGREKEREINLDRERERETYLLLLLKTETMEIAKAGDVDAPYFW